MSSCGRCRTPVPGSGTRGRHKSGLLLRPVWSDTGRSSSGSPVVNHLAIWVGDGVAPLGVGLPFGDLAGNVGDDRSISSELSRILAEAGQSAQVDSDVNRSAGSSGAA
jgi:hypothetical protein